MTVASAVARTPGAASAFLRVKKLRGANIVRVAARHNKREIAAELGAGGSIDADRISLNVCLTGPATAEEVAATAEHRLRDAGIVKLRKDAVRALEFLVSLPANFLASDVQFFADATDWLGARFGGHENLLSADIHRDEGPAHLHVLVLPLIAGRMRGSDAIGGPHDIRRLHREFFTEVCQKHGLAPTRPVLRGTAKAQAARRVLETLRRSGDPALKSAVWQVVRDCVEADPHAFSIALGLPVDVERQKRLRSFTSIMTSRGKGSAAPPSWEEQSELNQMRCGAAAPSTVMGVQ